MNPIVWSYSVLAAFIKCPRQYKAVRVDKLYPFVQGPEAAEGERQHKAFEDRIVTSTPLPPDLQHHEPMMAKLATMPGNKHAELAMGVSLQGKPTAFFGKDVWVRGKLDYVCESGEIGYYADYKTGKSGYADTTQLTLGAAMLFVRYPAMQEVKAALLFTKENKPIAVEYKRSDLSEMWESFMPDYTKLVRAHETNTFHAKPSGLCKRCPHTSCEFNKGG